MPNNIWYKANEDDTTWSEKRPPFNGNVYFSFDREETLVYSYSYPESLTNEQKRIFDQENPDLRDWYYEQLWRKKNPEDQIWWKETHLIGISVFSFDRKKEFNLFADYPHNLTKEQKEIFDRENPYWKEFFKDRSATHGQHEINR